jgi:hypothetical protein
MRLRNFVITRMEHSGTSVKDTDFLTQVEDILNRYLSVKGE